MAAMAATVRISNILIKRKVIEPDVLATAEEDARTLGIRLEKYLVDRRLVRSADMTLALAEYLNMPPSACRASPLTQPCSSRSPRRC